MHINVKKMTERLWNARFCSVTALDVIPRTEGWKFNNIISMKRIQTPALWDDTLIISLITLNDGPLQTPIIITNSAVVDVEGGSALRLVSACPEPRTRDEKSSNGDKEGHLRARRLCEVSLSQGRDDRSFLVVRYGRQLGRFKHYKENVLASVTQMIDCLEVVLQFTRFWLLLHTMQCAGGRTRERL